jgi:DNA-binding MarR family transcriptional regulator
MAPTLNQVTTVSLDSLEAHIGYGLRRAQIAVFGDFIESMHDVDLTPAKFSVLMLIDENPGVQQSLICEALGIQKTNFVALLHEFEQRGLAERRPNGNDRRTNALYLTRKGRALLRRAQALQSALENRLARRLGLGGRRQLLGLLKRLGADT